MNERYPEVAGDGERVATVTEFTRRVREALRAAVPAGWVRGEISNLRVQASGHVYFSLKDSGTQLPCVLFRGDAARQTVALRDGLQALVYGEVDVYEARGQYQLIVRAVVDHGLGDLQRRFEELKRRLASEGLFEPARKRPLPLAPACVGFVTSPTGAAVQDFIRILRRREWRGRLVVLPARVQGAGAADELAATLRAAADTGWFDLLVIGRGGGSVEDLWAFNEEVLVRAVAASPVPVISAVGHEIDYTLCDFAADARAETPSAAAELVTSRQLAVVERIRAAGESLERLAAARLEGGARRLEHARSRLRLLSPVSALERRQLRLDDLSNRLAAALRQGAQARRLRLMAVRTRFVAASPAHRIESASHRLLALWKRLESVSPGSVLRRGFALVRDEHGRPVSRAAGLSAGRSLVTEFADGRVRTRVE